MKMKREFYKAPYTQTWHIYMMDRTRVYQKMKRELYRAPYTETWHKYRRDGPQHSILQYQENQHILDMNH